MGADNKAVVRQWFDAVNAGDAAAILNLLTEDFEFESMMRRPAFMHYRWDRHQFAASPGAMSLLTQTPMQMVIVDMIAEGDKVAVEATTDTMMRSGKRYDNAYHLAFVMRDGMIAGVREYSCSALAYECFGSYNPGDAAEPASAD